MADVLLRFVHISDTHISADPHFNSDGAQHTPLIGAQALVHELNRLPFTPDFILHTGDVVNDGAEADYLAAHALLGEIRVPVRYLVGNHDDAEPLQRVMLGSATPRTPYDYEFEVNGVQFICLDSNRPAPPYRGKLSDAQFDWLDSLCRASDERPLIVALHHPVLPMGAPAWDDTMSLIGGERFHRILLGAHSRLRGVFSGHVHQNTEIVRDGIAYFTGLSSWYQMENYPDQETLTKDSFALPGFSVVVVTRDQLYVRQHHFLVDAGSLTN